MKMIDIRFKIIRLEERKSKILKKNDVVNEFMLKLKNKSAWLQYKSISLEISKLEFLSTELKKMENDIVKSNKGGKRIGAGRKSDIGLYTKTMRVPVTLRDYISTFITLYADVVNENPYNTEKIVIKRKVEEKDVYSFFNFVEYIKERHEELKTKRIKEEDGGRQLKLFEENNNKNTLSDE